MKLYTIRIRCTRIKVHCKAEVVADSGDHAVALVKPKFHRYVTNFLKMPSFDIDEMFSAAEIEVTEMPGAQVTKLDWDMYK